MKRIFFTVIFSLTAFLWIDNANAQQGKYVRKKVKPTFFIPETALDKPEKLPDFYVFEEEQYHEVKPKPVAVKQNQITNNEAPIETMVVQKVEEESIYLKTLKNMQVKETPEYKNKFDEYMKDLNIIAEQNIIPENKTLENDLAKMDSNFRVKI